ncbi:MAG: hypothetical protein HQK49_06855 [Oligoflexia bacterium]|nr:hypothetical protein [Oligoflexia bacterium]
MINLILALAMSTMFFIASEVCASNENHKIIDGKLYEEVSAEDTSGCEIILEQPSKQIDNFLEGVSCVVCKEKIAKTSAYCTLNKCKHSYCENCSSNFGITNGTITECLSDGQRCTNKNVKLNEITINKPSPSIKKKYRVLDLIKNNYKNLKLEKMNLRGLEISDENLRNNNFNNSIMDAKTRDRFLKLRFNFKSSICKDAVQYIKFINGLQIADNNAKIDRKIIDDFVRVSASKCILNDNKILDNDSLLAALLNSPSVAGSSLLLKSIIQEYFKTHSVLQLNSLLEKIKSEETHLLFKREGLDKRASSYEDYLLLMTPVKMPDQKDQNTLKESYVEKLKKLVNETKDFILDKSESKRFENDWEKKYRSYGDEENTVLALGGSHSCALKNDGTVVCWGYNGYKQSTPPEGLRDVKSIALGYAHSCALKNDGTVVCWGGNGDNKSTPPKGLRDVKSIALGSAHSCALKNDGTVFCWGNNYSNQSTPPEGLRDVKSITLGYAHSCALKNDGTVVCWGNNYSNQSTPPKGLRDVKSIALGGEHSCALKNDGTVVCWGDNQYKQSRIPYDGKMFSFLWGRGLRDVKSIALGGAHSCALKNDGTVVCWGDNDYNKSTPPEGLRVKID